jgi:phosphate transport system protein
MSDRPQELRTDFHQSIDGVRQLVAHLGASVVELIPRVTDILLEQDLEGAERVIFDDDEFDARALDVEERALRLLALQAPVANDLRQLAAALKLAPEIERSADLCCNICKAARRIYPHQLDPKLRGTIQRMSTQAQLEYKAAVEAYVNVDDAWAAAVPDMDDYLDDLHRDFVQQIFEIHADEGIELQVAVQLAMVARFYERLGDHAVNIAAKVRYVASGWMEEHDGAARHRARMLADAEHEGS